MKTKFKYPYPEENAPESGGVEPTTEAVKPTVTEDEVLGEAGKKALAEERSQRRALEKKVKEFEQKFGSVDLEKYQKLQELESAQLKAEAERQQKELESQKKYEESLALKDKTYSEEKQQLLKQIEELQSRLSMKDRAIADKEIERSFMIAFDQEDGYTEDAITLLNSPELRPWLKFDHENLEVIVVEPKTGDRATDDKGNYLNVRRWIQTWKPNKLRFFKPQNTNSGAGTVPARPGQASAATSGAPKLDPKTFNFEELMTTARAKKQ